MIWLVTVYNEYCISIIRYSATGPIFCPQWKDICQPILFAMHARCAMEKGQLLSVLTFLLNWFVLLVRKSLVQYCRSVFLLPYTDHPVLIGIFHEVNHPASWGYPHDELETQSWATSRSCGTKKKAAALMDCSRVFMGGMGEKLGENSKMF